MSEDKKIRVLIVDDSAIVRKILSEALSAEPDFEVIGTAPDPFIARDKILALNPDVLTLDVEMPRMDGLTFLKKLMKYHPMPAVIISSLAQSSVNFAMEAMRMGAVEVLPKPGGPYSVGDLRTTLAMKLRAVVNAKVRPHMPEAKAVPPVVVKSPAPITGTILAIGASTGGTEAISEVLMGVPEKCPPIVIAQHIPPGFSKAFAERLNRTCAIRVREAVDGDALEPGLALIAPGDFHMTIAKSGSGFCAQVKTGPKVCYQRPSVDVLFSSVAAVGGAKVVAALLTGMGADGARGMLEIQRAGGRTIAQDEASCVVFGMPREAIRLGAAQEVVSLDQISRSLLESPVNAGR